MAKRYLPTLFIFLLLGFTANCNFLEHGKPTEEERWRPPSEVSDFNKLYGQNCAGCHGSEGKFGAARPLNDPLFLALANADDMKQVISKGSPGTNMPSFGEKNGGNLTDHQIDLLVEGIRSKWANADQFQGVALPPYSIAAATSSGTGTGNSQNGAAAFQIYCAQCHGADGRGGEKVGSIVDAHYLALTSDQSLRTSIICGRQDMGKSDWRSYVSGRPMSPQEITDVVAWLASQRGQQTK